MNDDNRPHDVVIQRTQSIYTWLESQGTEGAMVLGELARLRARVADLDGVVKAARAACRTEHERYKGKSGNYDSYNEGRSDAGDAIDDAMDAAAAAAKAGG